MLSSEGPLRQRSRDDRPFIDRLAASAVRRTDEGEPSKRPLWWWLLFAPGKVMLWMDYMWPKRVTGIFGSARRRNVPLVEVLYSLYFYITLLAIIFAIYLNTK